MEQYEAAPAGSIPRDERTDPLDEQPDPRVVEPAPAQEPDLAADARDDGYQMPDAGNEPEPRDGASDEPAPSPLADGALDAPSAAAEAVPARPSLRRGLIYLAICLAFAAALLAPNLFSAPSSSSAPAPCDEGAALSQVLAVPGQSGAAPYLLAVVRPRAFPNIVPDDEPGCDALYRSDDDGITWTVSFSATAEAPSAVALAPASGQVYLLTLRMHFPLYVAANLYRSDGQAIAWTWDRVSPQGRHDVPMVSATDMRMMDDGTVILREGNGDGAALVMTRDGGVTWQPLVIPALRGVGSIETLADSIAVAPPLITPGQPPGLISDDHGGSWRPMGALPEPPARRDLRPLLSIDAPERALVLDLVPASVVGAGGTIARYYSLDGGRHWSRVHCRAQPAPGCTVATRWAQAAGARYVLYHGQVYQAQAHGSWLPLPAALPVASDTVLQLVAAPDAGHPRLYLATASGIWRWDGAAWRAAATGLPLGAPTPVLS